MSLWPGHQATADLERQALVKEAQRVSRADLKVGTFSNDPSQGVVVLIKSINWKHGISKFAFESMSTEINFEAGRAMPISEGINTILCPSSDEK